MTRPFTVENVQVLTEDLGSGRADYTTDFQITSSVTVQAERLEAIIFANINTITTTGATLPTTASVYDSGWQQSGDYIKIRGFCWADQAGTIFIEQTDEISSTTPLARVQTTQAYGASSKLGGFVVNISAPYVRVRFVPTTNPTKFIAWARLSN